MAHVITFRTARFDISKERPNPINPIAGESVLQWLRTELSRAHYKVSQPDTEDWGWYVSVEGDGASYLVGASADAEDKAAAIDWTVQVHKHRSLKERVLGKNKMAPDDPVSRLIEDALRADGGIEEIVVTREP